MAIRNALASSARRVVEDKPVTYSLTGSPVLAFTAGVSEPSALFNTDFFIFCGSV